MLSPYHGNPDNQGAQYETIPGEWQEILGLNIPKQKANTENAGNTRDQYPYRKV